MGINKKFPWHIKDHINTALAMRAGMTISLGSFQAGNLGSKVECGVCLKAWKAFWSDHDYLPFTQ